MPRYLVSSDGPISVRPIERPDLPGWTPEHPWVPGEGGPEVPDTGGPGGWPERPAHPNLPHLPPRDEWPSLPPWFQPGVGLPIPPTPEHPWVPVEPEDGVDPPAIWPPLPTMPDLPDLSGKTLILARFFVSRHVNFLRWVLVDTEEAMAEAKAAIEAVKAKLPAGGVGGRPPGRPSPS